MAHNYLRFIGLLVGVLVFNPEGFSQVKPQSIGTIYNVAVAKEEVQREMRKYRSEVYNVMASKNTITKSGNAFWEQEQINGVKAIDVLRKKAIDSLSIIKVQEKLLAERNLWPYKNYQEFLKDLKDSNESRKKSVATDQVIYGPVEYSEQTFFDYRFSNALIQLKHKLVAENLIAITEDDLQNKFKQLQKTVYKEEKYTLKAFTRQVREAYIEDAYKALINKYAKNAKPNIDKAKINQITLTN